MNLNLLDHLDAAHGFIEITEAAHGPTLTYSGVHWLLHFEKQFIDEPHEHETDKGEPTT